MITSSSTHSEILYLPGILANMQGFIFKFIRNGAGSLANGKIVQFWYNLGKVKKNMDLIN